MIGSVVSFSGSQNRYPDPRMFGADGGSFGHGTIVVQLQLPGMTIVAGLWGTLLGMATGV